MSRGVRDHRVIADLFGDLVGQQDDAGRFGETGEVERSVGGAAFATAEPPDHRLTVGREFHNGVITGVGDENAAFGGPHRLAREAKLVLLLFDRHVQVATAAQRPLGVMRLDEFGDDLPKGFAVSFSRRVVHDIAFGVDDDERRPRLHGVLRPGLHLRIVENRVMDLVALDRRLDRRGLPLVEELRRMHADGDQDVGELRLQRPQLVEHVEAVHTAAGPEVEQHDASAQLGELERAAARVQPDVTGQLGGAHAR
jgi:hypothetical protein